MFYSQNRILCGTSREITDRRKVGAYVSSVYYRLQGLWGSYRGSCTGHPPVMAMNHLSVLSQEWKQQNKVTADFTSLKICCPS